MRYTLFFILPALLLAKVHYAKVEPYESVTLKSAVSAEVVEVDLDSEGEMVHDKRVIHLDDHLDRVDLNASRQSLNLLSGMLDINNKIVRNLADALKRQRGYFERLNKLSTASKTQKDTAFNAYVSAQNQYLSTQEKIETLKKQRLEMKYKIERLKESILKKNIGLRGRYLYKLLVRSGDFVNPGSPLAIVQDLSRGKLTLFLEPSELKDILSKKIFINGNETQYRVDKVWSVADEKFISSYRVEIYIDKPGNYFSKLVKVELK